MSNSSGVLVFSGHMIDRPGRQSERFPERIVGTVERAIQDTLAQLDAGAGKTAMCQGACGGDLLFARSALQRGLGLSLFLPVTRTAFVQQSVAFANEYWTSLFEEVIKHPRTGVQILDPESCWAQEHESIFVCANTWMLASACDTKSNVQAVALWDGQRSGKPGGTDAFVDSVRRLGLSLHIIDLRRLSGGR